MGADSSRLQRPREPMPDFVRAAIVTLLVVSALAAAQPAVPDSMETAYEVTGRIHGTLAGAPFVLYTVANEWGLYDRATAQWDGLPPGTQPGVQRYRVHLHGTPSSDTFEPVQSIRFEFAFDDELNVYWDPFPASMPIAYFPDGSIFDLGLVYAMTDGTFEVTGVTWHGLELEIRGRFAGTLMRLVLSEEAMWTGELADPMDIAGEFHIWKAAWANR